MSRFENDYWWHKGKLNLIDSLLKKYLPNANKNPNILEIGCGTGQVMTVLKKYGIVTGMDVASTALSLCKERGFVNLIQADITTVNENTIQNKFDVIVALDILEHVQDDLLALSNMQKLLTDNGLLILSVPAHKFLWSIHDEALQHKRRYQKYELIKKLEDCNFSIIKNTYFVSAVFPMILLYRLFTNIFGRDAYPKTTYVLLPKVLNNLLHSFLKIESSLITKIGVPFGTSLVVVAKKSKINQSIC
jgi:2-polyprenyl-3-methyl-5-hydroxy-6-metoxy-1,4-benzoquinol methylase